MTSCYFAAFRVHRPENGCEGLPSQLLLLPAHPLLLVAHPPSHSPERRAHEHILFNSVTSERHTLCKVTDQGVTSFLSSHIVFIRWWLDFSPHRMGNAAGSPSSGNMVAAPPIAIKDDHDHDSSWGASCTCRRSQVPGREADASGCRLISQAAGCQPNARNTHEVDLDNQLLQGCADGRVEGFLALISEGADVNARRQPGAKTSLHLVATQSSHSQYSHPAPSRW